jgi:hypothetical protein
MYCERASKFSRRYGGRTIIKFLYARRYMYFYISGKNQFSTVDRYVYECIHCDDDNDDDDDDEDLRQQWSVTFNSTRATAVR